SRLASGLVTSAHVRDLEQHGFVVLEGRDAVVKDGVLAAARAEVSSFFSSGRFARSVNGKSVRQDLVCWLRETDGAPGALDPDERHLKPLGPEMLHCVRLLRGIAHELDLLGYSTSHDHQVHQQLQLGFYPGDNQSGYVRHLDHSDRSLFDLGLLGWIRAGERRKRTLTAILYLNDPAWSPSSVPRSASGAPGDGDGGELRCYHAACDSGQPGTQAFTDVVPTGGSLLIFDARRIEHEVLSSSRDRFALTCWITGTLGPGKDKSQT
ncbi:unnamed protein product, partial [Polarella glacialis]